MRRKTNEEVLKAFDKEAFAEILEMTAQEKLDLIRDAYYSDEHILKILVKIMFIAGPDDIEEVLSWLKNRVKEINRMKNL